MVIKLSFCIPTCNRIEPLKETLESVLSQKRDDMEIVISDNHSTDGTCAYVESMRSQEPCIRYHRWQEGVECGKNLLKVVELAQGEYCWLLADDDRLEPDSLQHVMELLDKYTRLSGLSVNVEGYDRHLKYKKRIRYSHRLSQLHLFEDAALAFTRLGAWLGFWSAQIVKRSLWETIVRDNKHFPFLGYHHLYILLRVIQYRPRWLFTDKKCIGYRADHESFTYEYGRVKRFTIDAFSYTTIGLELFQKVHVRKVNDLVLNQLLFWQLLTLKCEAATLGTLSKIFAVGWKYYKTYPVFWLKLVPLLFVPRRILIIMRYIYRKYFKRFR